MWKWWIIFHQILGLSTHNLSTWWKIPILMTTMTSQSWSKITMIVKSTRRPINFGKFTLEWMLSPDPFCYFSLKLSFSTSPQTHYSTFAVSFFGSLSFASSFNWDVLLFIPLLSLEKNNHIYKYSQKFHLAPHIYLFRNREKILVDLWFHIDIRLQVGRYVVAKVPMVQKRQLLISNTIHHF